MSAGIPGIMVERPWSPSAPPKSGARVRQFTTVVGSPFVDYWQPSAQSLLVFAKYGFKIGRRDAWVQFNADNLLKSKRYINETAFTNLNIYGITTPVSWRETTGVRF